MSPRAEQFVQDDPALAARWHKFGDIRLTAATRTGCRLGRAEIAALPQVAGDGDLSQS